MAQKITLNYCFRDTTDNVFQDTDECKWVCWSFEISAEALNVDNRNIGLDVDNRDTELDVDNRTLGLKNA